ncbi:hypothetical protein ACFXQA_05655 [Microbacterium sp. P07]|uniref:hypothetical protein n=1 Tax=Microbacterium sp. P07 TaxID=3366952 RepID=UPI00374748E1
MSEGAFGKWAAVFAGFDDAALAGLANAGVVRRARRELPQVTLAGRGDASATVRVGEATVVLSGAGPAAARCDCPLTGMCAHAIAAAMWLRDEVVAAIPADAPDADPIAELLAMSLAEVRRWAGVSTLRRVAEVLPEGADGSCEVMLSGTNAEIVWTAEGTPRRVLAVAGAGLAGLTVLDGPRDAAGQKAVALEAVVRLRLGAGMPWEWPADVAGVDRSESRTVAAQAGELLDAHLARGLAHVGADAAAEIRLAGSRARLARLPLLERLLVEAASRTESYAARDDATTQTHVATAFAHARALAHVLSRAAEPPPHLVGTVRQGSEAVHGETADPDRFVPVAAEWWRSPTGARGVTVSFWDTVIGEMHRATSARRAGEDPGFTRSWDAPALWEVSPARIAAGRFGLSGMEVRDDGSVSVTARTRFVSGAALTEDDLRGVRAADSSAIVTFGRARTVPVIVWVGRTLALAVDGVRQELVWSVASEGRGIEQFRLPAADQTAVGALIALIEDDRDVAAVAAEHRDEGMLPLTVFCAARGGLEAVSLSLTPVARPKSAVPTSRVLERLPRAGAAPVDPPLIAQTRAALEAVVSLAATGRRASPAQLVQLERRGAALDALGVSTAVVALANVGEEQSPAALARAVFFLDRTLQLARVRPRGTPVG